jgi:hypothetical protein
MVESYRQGKTADSSTRALWQSYQQCHLVTKQEELDERNDEFGLTQYLSLQFEGILHTVKSYDMGPTASLLLEGRIAADFYCP